MKIERTKNATRNIFFGGMLKIYQIIIPFIMRTIMIYLLGPGYTGLNGLFTSILQVLNLAELGVGSAMVFSMYEPIAYDDKKTICALMSLYRTYYRLIGLFIGIAGSILIPFIPRLIKADLPEGLNVYALYIMNLGATVLSYWLFAYRNSLLAAHQRNDVSSKVTLFTENIKYILQIIVLVVFRNYYLFVLAILLTQILNNVITAIISKKMYPEYEPAGRLPDEKISDINQRIRDLFTARVGTVIVGSADTIVVSAFLGLTSLTIYQNYYYPISAVMGIVSIIHQACTAGIGNSIVVETKEKNYRDLRKYTFLILWLAGFCFACFLTLYQPFMEIWVGKTLMLEYPAIVCFSLYFFINQINALLNLYKDASGIWHSDRYRPLVAALTNLAINLLLVQFWGLYGVILSTVIAILFVEIPWVIHNLFTVVFDRCFLVSYIRFLAGLVISILCVCTLTDYLALKIEGNPWIELIIRFIICLVMVNGLFFLIFRKKTEFGESIVLAKNILNGRKRVGK